MVARSEITLPQYSKGEEIANSITHGVGVVLSVAGLAVLTAFASLFGTVWHIVSCSIYGAMQVLLYTTSTLYHSIPVSRAKKVLRILDHSAIFLLIAGTYTPFALVNMRGPWGWSLLAFVWAIAIIGIVSQGFLIRRNPAIGLLLYVAMGWSVVVGIKPLIESVAFGGIVLLVLGGLCYTLGSLFYIWRRVKFHHAIWHLFVLGGSIFHFFAILFYVIPLAK